ncbi:MAG TPA: hypothetical protein DDY59_05235 [Lachnospiraceae bacterium]|nr:hypothetical protein [Lachnospiraceae bacterium]HCA70732.1 hypothetical protein [Lachnospiraceae bacterium]HCM14064.1 hypothetical protein [Lachnospiraceae bacterium]
MGRKSIFPRKKKHLHAANLCCRPNSQVMAEWEVSVKKKHLHTGRTAKFAHRCLLLVLPGF